MAYGAFEISKGAVNIRTVSPTKIGAMVNWLHLNGISITNDWPDVAVRFAFKANGHLVRLAEVDVTITKTDVPLE